MASPEIPINLYQEPSSYQHQSLIHHILAGTVAASVADTIIHPIDTLKTRLQSPYRVDTRTAPIVKESSSQTNPMAQSIKTLKANGSPLSTLPKNNKTTFFSSFSNSSLRIRSIYAGFTPMISGSMPSAAIFFATYETVKWALIPYSEPLAFLTGGLCADLVSSLTYVPTEVIKTRMQLQTAYTPYRYKNIADAVRDVYLKEGFKGIFGGYGATLARDLPFSALQFAFYEELRINFIESKNEVNISKELLCGAIAGSASGIITTPLDVIKTTQQTSRKKHNIVNTFKLVVENNGTRALFKGVGPRAVWTGVQSSIMFVLYQAALRELQYY